MEENLEKRTISESNNSKYKRKGIMGLGVICILSSAVLPAMGGYSYAKGTSSFPQTIPYLVITPIVGGLLGAEDMLSPTEVAGICASVGIVSYGVGLAIGYFSR